MYSKHSVLCFIALNTLLAASTAAPASDGEALAPIQNMRGSLEPEFLKPPFEDPKDYKKIVDPMDEPQVQVLPIYNKELDQVPKGEESSRQVPQTAINQIAPLVGADQDKAKAPPQRKAEVMQPDGNKQVAKNLLGSDDKPQEQMPGDSQVNAQPVNNVSPDQGSQKNRPVNKLQSEKNAVPAAGSKAKTKGAKNRNTPVNKKPAQNPQNNGNNVQAKKQDKKNGVANQRTRQIKKKTAARRNDNEKPSG